MDKFLQALCLHNNNLKDISVLFQAEMKKGLSVKSRAAASVKMLPTHVSYTPTGSEKGQFLALDLGESHFKVQRVKLGDDELKRKVEIHEKMFPTHREWNGRAEEILEGIYAYKPHQFGKQTVSGLNLRFSL